MQSTRERSPCSAGCSSELTQKAVAVEVQIEVAELEEELQVVEEAQEE